jgi:hypothetical protein
MAYATTSEALVKCVASDAITFSDVNIATKIVTIGTHVYTSHAAPDTVADQYKVSATTEELAAQYLTEAINASGTAGNFGSLTVANDDVVATQNGAIVILTAKVAGVHANGIVVSTNETNGVAGGGTLAACAGTNGSGNIATWVPLILAKCDPKSATANALRELIGV